MSRDLSEPLAYALVLAGLAAWWWDERSRPWLAGVLFALAALARESTLLFPAGLALATFLGFDDGIGSRRRRDRRAAVILGATALVPYVVLRLLLLAWLGTNGAAPGAVRFAAYPFGGFLGHWPLDSVLFQQFWGVILPALLSVALVAWFTRRLGPSLLTLALNVAVLVVFLPAPSYDLIIGSSRIALGVTCAFLACLPLVPVTQRGHVALGIAVLSMSPWYVFFPEAFGRL